MVDNAAGPPRPWFLAGLFLTAFATLNLEIVDTRLLSVSTWYHLSFFAVSTAMFGMAAGAVRVYLDDQLSEVAAARAALARNASRLAFAIPVFHVVTLFIPIPTGTGPVTVAALSATALALSIPFYLSGLVIATALTRIPGNTGFVYFVDLLGAALGSVGVLLIFEFSNIASGATAIGAIAALSAACFHRDAGTGRAAVHCALAFLLLGTAVVNDSWDGGLRTRWAKGIYLDPEHIEYEFWTVHGQVVVLKSNPSLPFYWAKLADAEPQAVELRDMRIDGEAATMLTRWDGTAESLAWARNDITALPYHLRKGGHNAVIGVGGGRDILTALWGGSESVTGIEVNAAFIELLEVTLRDYAGIADDPRVTLVHDDGRSFLTRTSQRFDVLQMSLVDTWAATGAGAFTLSENGLYTREAWQAFLGALTPGGVLSVSRWFDPRIVSETSRLVALATAALLDSGVTDPRAHIILAARDYIATLIVSNEPLRPSDMRRLAKLQKQSGVDVLLAPGLTPRFPMLGHIASSRTLADIEAAVEDRLYDYTPPTDDRPYFFNILKPVAVFRGSNQGSSGGVIGAGSLLATQTLGILWIVTLVLVLATVLGPLARSGLPSMRGSSFALSVVYFAGIGLGFMFVQIPLMQRFSVYLGHPIYSLAVILFAMILATGLGSLLSDRIDVATAGARLMWIPLGIAANLLVWTLSLQPLIENTVHYALAGRIGLTATVVFLAALPLGLCFPLGLRLVRRFSEDATPWMWGVNGAAGVLASVTSVAVSMWLGISASLYLAAFVYASLALPMFGLWRGGEESSG